MGYSKADAIYQIEGDNDGLRFIHKLFSPFFNKGIFGANDVKINLGWKIATFF